jgi:Rieske Fe-S protein
VLGGAASLVVWWMAPVLSAAQNERGQSRPITGDVLVKVGDASMTPLRADDIAPDAAPTIAWPMDPVEMVVRNGSRLNRVVLVRLDPGRLVAGTRSASAGGVVAYSAICTHSGCDVGGWIADEQALYCECHESKFDPNDAARVIDGPAPRSLPALPLGVADGRLVVAGSFSARVGFGAG